MSDTQDPRPSLPELRALSAYRRKGYENQAIAGFADTVFDCTVEIRVETFDALLDIAEAAQAVAHEADSRIVSMCANYGVDVHERLAKLRGEPWPPAALSDALEVA